MTETDILFLTAAAMVIALGLNAARSRHRRTSPPPPDADRVAPTAPPPPANGVRYSRAERDRMLIDAINSAGDVGAQLLLRDPLTRHRLRWALRRQRRRRRMR